MGTSPDAIDALDRLLEPVGRCLTPEVARKIVELRADADLQARIDELADKSTEGRLSEEARAQYETIVRGIDFIAVLKAKARAVLNRSESP